MAQDRIEHFRTGGGTFVSQVTPIDEQVMAIVGDRFKPLTNQFDSDATFHYNLEYSLYFINFIFVDLSVLNY